MLNSCTLSGSILCRWSCFLIVNRDASKRRSRDNISATQSSASLPGSRGCCTICDPRWWNNVACTYFGYIQFGVTDQCYMYKISDVVNQLFSHLPSERLRSFSCGHIIPSSNLQTLVVSVGPCGGALEYKAGKQSDPTTVCVPISLDSKHGKTPVRLENSARYYSTFLGLFLGAW